jgi:hypothetical protein
VLLELGFVAEAEADAVSALDHDSDDLDALSLYAKVKHIRGELSVAIECWERIARLVHRGELARPPDNLALIASAWLAELVGDPAAASRYIDDLESVHGYEHDHDRILGLARAYEQLDTPTALAAAGWLYRHLADDFERRGIARPSLIGSLATVERRAGREGSAVLLEKQFLAAVRRRMHRPTLAEIARIGAEQFLPVERLRRVRAHGELSSPSRRERAVAAIVRGHLNVAADGFATHSEPLDHVYLGALAAARGEEVEAVGHLVTGITGGADDVEAAGWLLEHHAGDGVWKTHAQRRAMIDRIEEQRERDPLRPALWRRLAELHMLDGRPSDSRACTERAKALDVAWEDREHPIGRVNAASIYRMFGKAKGLVHELWAYRTPCGHHAGGTLREEDIHGNVTPELRGALRNTFIAVREYARAKLPHATTDLDDYCYAIKLPKEDEPSGGLSAGLPSALAFLSVFLQQPVSRELAASGAAIAEAHDVISIGRVGDTDHKVKAAYHGNLRTLLLPEGNREDLERSKILPREITAEIVEFVTDLDHAVRLVFGADVFTRV